MALDSEARSGPRSALRREQVQILLASIPILIGAYFLVGAVGSFSDRPYVVAVVLLPLLAVVLALGAPLVRERRVLLGGGFLPFFVAYCVLFALAAGTRVLEGRRTSLDGFEGETPSNVLGLNRLGDWHYRFAPQAPDASDIVVITLPSFGGQSVNDARMTEANLIAMAADNGAKGIAFDLLLTAPSAIDRIFCFQAARAEAAGVPVVLGYGLDTVQSAVSRAELAPQLAQCIRIERQGTVMGLREADLRVRMVPTSHLGQASMRSFSYRIAALLAPGTSLPDVGLTQFVGPRKPPVTIAGVPDSAQVRVLRDRFVIVGSSRAGDVFDTPYGPLSGVMIHAYAAHALRSNFVIRRVDVRWTLGVVFLICYLLTLIQARGAGVRALWIGAALIALAIVVAAAVAMRVGLLWIDTSYPLLAVGLLAATLTGGARLQKARVHLPRTELVPSETAAAKAEPFDVFLSHNSQDKPAVIELAEALRDRNVRVWLDAWELVPGERWQAAIEQAILNSRTAAVIVGPDGIGPWEEPEMRACLDECVRRKMAVIPVLLPDAGNPALPLFLRQFTWVDFRKGVSDAMLDRLEWGITGVKPKR